MSEELYETRRGSRVDPNDLATYFKGTPDANISSTADHFGRSYPWAQLRLKEAVEAGLIDNDLYEAGKGVVVILIPQRLQSLPIISKKLGEQP